MTDEAAEFVGDAAADATADAAVENVCDEFVDMFNARDLDGIADLVSADVTSDLFDGTGVESAVEGIAGLFRRYPQLVATRGEEGHQPIVALWLPDEQDHYTLMGYLELSTQEELIDRIAYVDTPGSDLLVEEPDPDEMAEWQDWREWDTGEEANSRQGAD
ncbi:MAG: hypothetical protein ACXWH0_04880 [Acidimicrobiia bacterium]